MCGHATKVWPTGREQLLNGGSEERRHIYNVAVVVNWLEPCWWGQRSIEMAAGQPKDSRSTTPWCHCISPAALTLGLRWGSNLFLSCWPTFESFYDSHPCVITKTTLIHPVPKAGSSGVSLEVFHSLTHITSLSLSPSSSEVNMYLSQIFSFSILSHCNSQAHNLPTSTLTFSEPLSHCSQSDSFSRQSWWYPLMKTPNGFPPLLG